MTGRTLDTVVLTPNLAMRALAEQYRSDGGLEERSGGAGGAGGGAGGEASGGAALAAPGAAGGAAGFYEQHVSAARRGG